MGIKNMSQTAARLGYQLGHSINIFKFEKHTFVGFEYRRIDYKRDAAVGRNKVVKIIEQGIYK